MDSKYCEKFGDIFWTIKNHSRETYKGGKEEDLSILKNINQRENKELADIGGGNGYFSSFIMENFNFKKVYNVEINKSLCEISSKTYKKVTTINNNITDLEMSNKIDVVLFFNSFFYIPEKDYEKLFNNLKMILSDDGIILINKHFTGKKKNYSLLDIFWIKLINIKTYFFSGKFNILTAAKFFFSKFDFNFERSENTLLLVIENNQMDYNYDPKNNFITIRKKVSY